MNKLTFFLFFFQFIFHYIFFKIIMFKYIDLFTVEKDYDSKLMMYVLHF